MGSASPPKRMTRSRAAAASASAAILSSKQTASARVTKSSGPSKAATASAKKPAAATKPAPAKKAAPEKKKAAPAKKPVAARKSTAKAAAKTATSTSSAIIPTPTLTPAAASTSAVASTSTAITRPTTRKRKLHTSDDNDVDDDDEDDLSKEVNPNTQRTMNRPAKKLRGSTKKAVDPETDSESELESATQHPKSKGKKTESTASAPVTKPTRGRPKKSVATTATASATDNQTSSAVSRTRKRKADTQEDVAAAAKQPAKKNTRGRKAIGTVTTDYSTEPTPGLKSAVSRPASKPSGILKKTVTFEEPGKENALAGLATEAKTETPGAPATGMRAKPVRKNATSGRTTRASARAATMEPTEKRPLSPRKDGQNRPLSRDSGSDDELATYEKTPLKPLMKSPVKPPSGAKKLELPPLENEKEDDATQSVEPILASVLSSPARRPPPSPFKDAMKSPAKRVEAIPSLILPSASSESQDEQSLTKSTMLQSPAKRPHMPLQAFQFSPERPSATRSPTKMSMLNTPAKRPASPLKLFGPSVQQTEDKPQEVLDEQTDTAIEQIADDLISAAVDQDADEQMSTASDQVSRELTPTAIDQDTDEETPTTTHQDADEENPAATELLPAEQTITAIDQDVDETTSIASDQVPDELTPTAIDQDTDEETLTAIDQDADEQTPAGMEITADEQTPAGMEIIADEQTSTATNQDADEEIPVAKELILEEQTITAIDQDADEQTPTAMELISDEQTSTAMAQLADEQLQSQIRADTGAISSPEYFMVATKLETIQEAEHEDSTYLDSPTPQPAFPSSFSPVLPRLASVSEKHIDPAEVEATEHITEVHAVEVSVQPTDAEQHDDPSGAEPDGQFTDSADKCETNAGKQTLPSPTQTAPPQTQFESESQAKGSQDGDFSDSEDELALSNEAMSERPKLRLSEAARRAARRAINISRNAASFNYSPHPNLRNRRRQQKSDESDESEDEHSLLDGDNPFDALQPLTRRSSRDKAKIRASMEAKAKMETEAEMTEAEMEAFLEADIAAKYDKHDFNDLELEDEDGSPVKKDDRLSLINAHGSVQSDLPESSSSGASQVLSNETSVSIDPALIGNKADDEANSGAYTVSKRPLERGDDSPPRSVKRQRSTVSKRPFRRVEHSGYSDEESDEEPEPSLATVFKRNYRLNMFSDYTDEKSDEESELSLATSSKSVSKRSSRRHVSSGYASEESDGESEPSLATSSKPVSTPSIGTPARITRPDLDSNLLRGAIVFVDVHTAEGTDAGRIFVDVLIRMGARCVKSWPWNPTSEPDLSKVGITHVVYKDGGKRTLEKVIESKGAVKCVGVSWILDCEKNNRWMDEKNYRVDTTVVPRGGQNRRKSMEPTAIANVNGTLVTPTRAVPSSSREPQTVPNNYMSRRDSTLWTRSPSENDTRSPFENDTRGPSEHDEEDEDEDAPSEPSEMDWEATNAIDLIPLPQTPAPETVARFAQDVTPGSPTTRSFDSSAGNNQHLLQTCPPRPSSLITLGERLVYHDQSPAVAMRLNAARRQSMQYAPKKTSPLKKQWK